MMLKYLNSKKSCELGFTVVELLIAMLLMVLVVIGVLRFMAMVAVNQDAGGARHNQATQTRIALSNIGRDVAGVGFEPLTSKTASGWFTNERLGVTLSACTSPNCIGQQLNVGTEVPQFWEGTTEPQAHDCYGATNFADSDIRTDRFSRKWVLVYNQYSIVKDAANLLTLRCKGNGSVKPVNRILLKQVNGAQWALTEVFPNRRMVSLCIVTQEDAITADGSSTLTDCSGKNILAAANGTSAFYKTTVDMMVRAVPFLAGQ